MRWKGHASSMCCAWWRNVGAGEAWCGVDRRRIDGWTSHATRGIRRGHGHAPIEARRGGGGAMARMQVDVEWMACGAGLQVGPRTIRGGCNRCPPQHRTNHVVVSRWPRELPSSKQRKGTSIPRPRACECSWTKGQMERCHSSRKLPTPPFAFLRCDEPERVPFRKGIRRSFYKGASIPV